MCLTFEARAWLVVTREAFRTQHGRATGRKTSRHRGGSGKITGGVVRRCRRGGTITRAVRVFWYKVTNRAGECTLRGGGNTAAARVEDAQEVRRPGAFR